MTQESQSIVQISHVTKTFRDFWLREKVTAVNDLDMDIRQGEVFGLLGPNGSGKTTTIKMMLGLLFPSRGRILVFGRSPSDVLTKARIGFLPEESYLYPFLDARETLDYYGRLFQIPRATRMSRIDMLLDMVGLSGVASRRIGEYSKGMQRRIGLAQALINDPDLLILDEPTSGMDPIGARQFKDLIITLGRRGKTIILSSHLLADVEDVCSRLCILYGGRVRAQGGVNDLLAKANLTQIITERLDEKVLERIVSVLDEAGRQIVEVAQPRDRLEALFLRIVEEAQRQKLTTGGAVAGGRVAEFLRAPEGESSRQVIEQLVDAAQPGQQEAASPIAPETTPPPIEMVIDDLVRAEEPAPQVRSADKGSSAKAESADRSVIDGLIGGDDGSEG